METAMTRSQYWLSGRWCGASFHGRVRLSAMWPYQDETPPRSVTGTGLACCQYCRYGVLAMVFPSTSDDVHQISVAAPAICSVLVVSAFHYSCSPAVRSRITQPCSAAAPLSAWSAAALRMAKAKTCRVLVAATKTLVAAAS